jgi:hypothetical protein
MTELNEVQAELCRASETDYSDLRALFINCTLKRSPEVSNTQGLMDISEEIMCRNGVAIENIRAVSGPMGGGTSVTITGTDLEEASAVSFGAEPASSFTVDSESQITAVAPAAAAGTAQISVTTAAGKATFSQSVTYVAPTSAAPTTPATVSRCIVPKLKGKKLKASEKAL